MLVVPFLYDWIFVGGGLAGTVATSQMLQYNSSLKILLIEAGLDTRGRQDILYPNATTLGGDLAGSFRPRLWRR